MAEPFVCPMFTIVGPPRTKKTHSQIIPVRGQNRSILIPSAQYTAWFTQAMSQAAAAKSALLKGLPSPFVFPIVGPLGVQALFYRERNAGDLCGFLQALGDFLQSPRESKTSPGKLSRRGSGIIDDDAQIISFDGSRLLKDAARPRVEITITIYEGQAELPLEEEW
jgi:hypothetical protein